ncbi:DUF2785 domain-containing protein [Oenococcus oeni]|uniref:DUF2785 domain-containing protein n=1 Tax=Oenococcus oeni TaxID=1247 RepID=UPI0008F85B93|nr:DUF2785 domain-containing protein [Oenococcus oeni]OIL47012.1 hypothetical protein ATX16_03070 [Oenococcus oeni]
MIDDQITLVKNTVSQARDKLSSGKIYQSLNGQLENLVSRLSRRSKTIVKPVDDGDAALALMQKTAEKFIQVKKVLLTDDQLFEVLRLLASTNPAYRDRGAFYFLTDLISNKALSPEQMRWMANYLVADERLFGHILEPLNDGVFQRSFSLLVLGQLLSADAQIHFIDTQLRDRIINQVIAYSLLEHDGRGFVGEKGWAHAFTNIGNVWDLLCANPSVKRSDKILLLASLLVGYHNCPVPFVAGEDSRIVAYLANITNLNEIYEDYFLRVLKFWHQGLTAQMTVATEAGWNKIYNRNRLLQVLLLQKDSFPSSIIDYIQSTRDYLN